MKYRVSHVESFRQWRDDEDAEEADLIDSIMGSRDPSAAMLAGTAFHKALETASTGDVDALEVDGYRFDFARDFEIALPPVREIRASKTYMVDGHPIVISGQCDALHGRTIFDHKTTARFDPDRYLSGYQWRLYLDIFGADEFMWNVFEWSEAAEMEYMVQHVHQLKQYRYPTMEADCASLVSEFARFVRERVETTR